MVVNNRENGNPRAAFCGRMVFWTPCGCGRPKNCAATKCLYRISIFLRLKSEFFQKMAKNGHFSVHVHLGGLENGNPIASFCGFLDSRGCGRLKNYAATKCL